MCGEIEDWQISKNVFVRITGTGAQRTINLAQTFARVEEIRIEEILITGFNGGVSAAYYLDLNVMGLHPDTSNNENVPGVLMMQDVANPHTVFQRPRVVAKGHMVTVSSLNLSLTLPTGAAVTFTEAAISIVVVCRRSPDELEEIRNLKASADYAPSIRDAAARNTFNPRERGN